MKFHQETNKIFTNKLLEEQLQVEIIKLKNRNTQLELIASYAKDVIDFWPSMTFRNIRLMIPKMDSLKEALGLVSK